MKRFPKLEIVKGSLSEKDGSVQEAIGRCDFFLRGPGMGQTTDFMAYCNKIGKPWGLQGSRISPTWSPAPARKAHRAAQQRGVHLLPRFQDAQDASGRRREAAGAGVGPGRLLRDRRARRGAGARRG
jgi:hypothetical protein